MNILDSNILWQNIKVAYRYYIIEPKLKLEPKNEDTQNWIKVAQTGYIRMGIIILLSKKPSHGYEIMKEIENRTKGLWAPTPGGVYPILRDLEKSGYIKGEWHTHKNRQLKIYKITPSGEIILKQAIIKQSEIFSNMSNLFTEFARDVLNIEPATPPLNIPSPLNAFLEDKDKNNETLQTLETHRKHLTKSIKTMRQRLTEVNQKIAEIKKQQPPPETKEPNTTTHQTTSHS
ncbi:MAG: PadR family transcriptional regulator [Nitrososphaerota archaeon]|nr:PadR family transcriptional regulator [Nitrososphaerota archaeon]